jgi:hypothetical protein
VEACHRRLGVMLCPPSVLAATTADICPLTCTVTAERVSLPVLCAGFVAVFVIAGPTGDVTAVFATHIFLSFHTVVRGDVPVIARARQAATNVRSTLHTTSEVAAATVAGTPDSLTSARLMCSTPPRPTPSGRHCEYTQARSACDKGYFRAYVSAGGSDRQVQHAGAGRYREVQRCVRCGRALG